MKSLKKYSTIVILLIFTSGIKGQSYLADSTYWRKVHVQTMGGSPSVVREYQMYTLGDTIIEGKTYLKLYNDAFYFRYCGAVREEAGKVYSRLQEHESRTDEEVLLYDFTLEEGETFNTNTPVGIMSGEGWVVRKVDTIIIENGEKRKRIHFDDENVWIEGIGNLNGFDDHVISHATNGVVSYLKCSGIKNEVLYRNVNYCNNCPCTLNIPNPGASIFNVNAEKSDAIVSPNPVEDKVTILVPVNNNESYTYRLFDQTGKLLHEIETNSNIYTLDMSFCISGGVYLLSVEAGNQKYQNKLLKK